MEASTLTSASRFALIARRSPLLRLQGDEKLIALTREGNDRAFEALVERYQARLHAFCRGMLGSTEDAEDVLQEVFVAAHAAIRADNRPINARPWLFRIARNRCLNHLRRPAPEGQDSMDVHPAHSGASVDDRVQSREDFRALLADVRDLPETQRTALLLRELEALRYDEIAQAMETTVPAVKSLLVRARMQLAECSQARQLTCDEVHLELAEAAEGLRKVSGPVRAHLRRCERCREYRAELRHSSRQLAALSPIGPLAALYHLLAGKLGLGGGVAGTGAGTASAGAGAAGAGAAGGAGVSGAVATGVAASGAAGALGTKAAAGVASVALITAGAVEVNKIYTGGGSEQTAPVAAQVAPAPPAARYGTEQRADARREARPRKRRARGEAALTAAPLAPELGAPPAPVPTAAPEPSPAADAGETTASGPPAGEIGVSAAPEAGSGIATPPAGGSASGPLPGGDKGDPPPPAEPPAQAEEPPAGEVEPQPEPEPEPGPEPTPVPDEGGPPAAESS